MEVCWSTQVTEKPGPEVPDVDRRAVDRDYDRWGKTSPPEAQVLEALLAAAASDDAVLDHRRNFHLRAEHCHSRLHFEEVIEV